MPTRQHDWYVMFTMLQFASVWQVEYAYTTSCLVFHVHNASIRFCLTSGVCLHDMKYQHAWYFMFTMLQFAFVWQVEYAYTTSCLVFHVHNASIRFCLTSVVCLHDIMLGISCSRCFNSLLFDKWSMPTRQHAWYFMFTMLQFASVWQVEYAYTTTWLVCNVHDASIRFCLTSGVCLHDIMLGISCSQCFNSLLFNKWSMPTRQHAWYFMFTMLQFAFVWQVEYAYTTSCLVFHVHNASIRFCFDKCSMPTRHHAWYFMFTMLQFASVWQVEYAYTDNMLGISCSQCFNSLLFNKWSMPTRQHAWYFMFTMLQFASI